MAPRLKVYQARMGFFDSAVAAPSQKAALEAWGTRQDLFHEGLASVTQDPQAVEAALANPGVVMQRPVGSKGAFEPAATASALPQVPPAPARPKPVAHPAEPPPPDRSALTAAERTLAQFEKEQASALADLEKRRADLQRALKDLDARELDLRREGDSRRRELERDLDRARKAYEKAGGKP